MVNYECNPSHGGDTPISHSQTSGKPGQRSLLEFLNILNNQRLTCDF